jgi:pimeloyl-ACP methyl ester carboxylesterase
VTPVALALAALAALVVLVVATVAHLRFWTARLTLPMAYASEEELATPDGARFVLRRVPRPASAPALEAPPVLLVHGLGVNHRNQDLTEQSSLARHLAALGRDVWLLTLRSGLVARSSAERRRVRFDAMVDHDVPLAVAGVLSRTGAEALDYVGFSMGGMLLYAALGRTVPAASVRRVVIFGSPGEVRVAAPIRALVRLLPRALVPAFHFRFLSRLFAFASEWFGATPFHVSVNARNLPRGITRTALVNIVEDVPGPLNADFAAFASAGGPIRAKGEPALDGLARLDVPVLFFAGAGDKIAPAPTVRVAFDAWARERPETPKRFVVLGRAHGHREDYGHGDMAIGTHVVEEIFPSLVAFLAAEPVEREARVDVVALDAPPVAAAPAE